MTGQRQKVWDRGDVPVRVGNPGVTDISGQEIDHVIDTVLLLITAQQGAADVRVAEVVHARQGIVAATGPLQSRAEAREGVMHHAIAEGRSTIGNQEGLDAPIIDSTPTGVCVSLQRRHGGGMQRHQA